MKSGVIKTGFMEIMNQLRTDPMWGLPEDRVPLFSHGQ